MEASCVHVPIRLHEWIMCSVGTSDPGIHKSERCVTMYFFLEFLENLYSFLMVMTQDQIRSDQILFFFFLLETWWLTGECQECWLPVQFVHKCVSKGKIQGSCCISLHCRNATNCCLHLKNEKINNMGAYCSSVQRMFYWPTAFASQHTEQIYYRQYKCQKPSWE